MIQNSDVLTVQGVIVAAYGGFISTFLSKPNIWNPVTIFLSALFAVSVVASLLVGIVACNRTSRSTMENLLRVKDREKRISTTTGHIQTVGF